MFGWSINYGLGCTDLREEKKVEGECDYVFTAIQSNLLYESSSSSKLRGEAYLETNSFSISLRKVPTQSGGC